jgi:hypothetical protein
MQRVRRLLFWFHFLCSARGNAVDEREIRDSLRKQNPKNSSLFLASKHMIMPPKSI